MSLLAYVCAREKEREADREGNDECTWTRALASVNARDSAGDRPMCLRKSGIFTPY